MTPEELDRNRRRCKISGDKEACDIVEKAAKDAGKNDEGDSEWDKPTKNTNAEIGCDYSAPSCCERGTAWLDYEDEDDTLNVLSLREGDTVEAEPCQWTHEEVGDWRYVRCVESDEVGYVPADAIVWM